MSEASEIFDMIRQAVAFSEPDCGTDFETFAFGNETVYKIWLTGVHPVTFDNGKIPMSWRGDDEFLNGSYDDFLNGRYGNSIWNTAGSIVDLVNDESTSTDYGCEKKAFLLKYPKIVDIFRTVSESSSSEELRLRLTASGLL